ncbi:MAG: DISARM system SNF2-like helicase DrmD [Actinomycetota bacterium]|nr:DISARM system SNF2-like helicase DrmD [Actinomycetota bacterium]
MISNPPDPGQLVDVRRRRFVVTEVEGSSLRQDHLREDGVGQQHLVTLSSVEDDAMGEELRVVWELEPGARALEKGALPDPRGFDDPRRLDAFLDAVRWGAVSSANLRALQAPFRSGVDIEDYQLDPVVRALGMPRVNLLVADDVGLGKTIETGLVAQELMLRHRARTVLVVCPASIQIQWRDQMRDKFGLEFRIVDSALMKDLRRRRGLHVNPWTHFPRLITSMDFLKRERVMRRFREALPPEGEPAFPRRFDLLVVDEAHNVAPSGTGRYATDSARTQAIRTIAPHFEHKLFLTATPHNGYPESFSSLLELLDPQRFARGVPPDKEQLGRVMVRRLKSELPPRWDGTPRFPKRKLEPLEVGYTEAERRAHAALREYTDLRHRGASDDAEKFATEFVLKLLKKRLFSSPAAFSATLEQHERSLETATRRIATKATPKIGVLRRQIEGIDEDFADDEAYEEATDEAMGAATRLFREPDAEERELLRELREFGRNASARADSKAERLIRWLEETVKPEGEWGETRAIIFTEYRATQKWLAELLASAGLSGGGRLAILHGGMNGEDREVIKAAFQADPSVSPVRILLATDAASEGIDLQNHCSRLVHYEIPWNPNRMEQRNGRVDRHGQRADEVLVYHFVGEGYDRRRQSGFAKPGDLEGDLEFLARAAAKVETIREDLGKVGPVIAGQVEQAMLGRRTTLDTSHAERGAEPVRRLLRFERRLAEQLERMREQLDETKRELGLSPESVRSVVEVGLDLAGQPPLIPADVPGLPSAYGRPRSSAQAFRLPALSGSWARCTEGLAHPHTGESRPVVFDHNLADGRDDLVLAHLNHRLVEMCLRLLRAEVWSQQDSGERRLNRVTARLVPDTALRDPAVVAHGRLVVLGGDNHRLHEEVIAAGGILREGRFARMNVGETNAALLSALPKEAPESVKESIRNLWPSHRDRLFRSLEVRMEERTRNLGRFLDERAEEEASGTRAILEELARSIREELEGPEDQLQLELFSTPEREQFERNKGALKSRLRSIPDEIERETRAIRARYADPFPRLFPVSVTYLIPERVAREAGGRR